MKFSLKQSLQSASLRGGLFYASFFGLFGIIMPFMNLELSRRGFTGLQIGAIGSIRSVVILVMASIFSRIADKHSIRVKMIRWFMIMAGIGVALFSFPKTFPWLVAAAVFMSFWQSPLDSLANSILVRMAKKYAVDFGMMTFWGAAAFATTNLVGGAIWDSVGFNWIYLTGGVMYLLVSFIAATLEEPQPEDQPPEVQPKKTITEHKQPLKPVIIVFLAGFFVFSLAFFNAFGFTGPILDMRGASEFIIGLVGTMIGLGGMFVRWGNQRLLTWISLESAMILGIMMGVIPIIVYGWVENVTILLLVSLLRGAGWGMFSLCAIRFIDNHARVENASTLQSSLVMLNTFSNIISSTLSGYLFDTNPTLIFVISTIAALVALGILLVVQRMSRKETIRSLAEAVPKN